LKFNGFFRYLTCKDRLRIGTWRLFIVLSIPLFIPFVFPGLVFWLSVHTALWIKEGYDSDKGVKTTRVSTGPIFHWHLAKEISLKKLGTCKKCGSDVGYFNLEDGYCKTCVNN